MNDHQIGTRTDYRHLASPARRERHRFKTVQRQKRPQRFNKLLCVARANGTVVRIVNTPLCNGIHEHDNRIVFGQTRHEEYGPGDREQNYQYGGREWPAHLRSLLTASDASPCSRCGEHLARGGPYGPAWVGPRGDNVLKAGTARERFQRFSHLKRRRKTHIGILRRHARQDRLKPWRRIGPGFSKVWKRFVAMRLHHLMEFPLWIRWLVCEQMGQSAA